MHEDPQPTEIRVRARGSTFAALSWGPPSAFPVIALHGWLDNAASFRRMAPRLRGLRVIALDLAGHGHSDHRPAGSAYTDCDHAADVICVLEALGLRELSLLGHSLGAGIACLVAGAVPRRIRSVTCIEALGVVPAKPSDAPLLLSRAARRWRRVESGAHPVFPTPEAALPSRMHGLADLQEQAARHLVERNLRGVPGGVTWRWDMRLLAPPVFRLTEEQIGAFLARIEAPVDVVLAKGGMTEFHEGIRRRLGLLRCGHLLVLPGGHHLHLEEADDAIAALVAERVFAHSAPSLERSPDT